MAISGQIVNVGDHIDVSYSGGVQEYEIPFGGIYKLEVWGAKGGNANNKGGVGGKGGYSTGYIKLPKNKKIYIAVGGAGSNSPGYVEGLVVYGGYNGGGNGRSQYNFESGGGGGATHIAPISGLLSDIDVWNEVYIVAGGGGGCEGGNTGGYGGGTTGQTISATIEGVYCQANGGTQTTGYAKGVGQSCTNASGQIAGGGGGGYYGGYTKDSPYPKFLSGAGGSGYIGGVPEFIFKGTTYTPSTSGNNNNGNGKATITFVAKAFPTIKIGDILIEGMVVNDGTRDIEIEGLAIGSTLLE